MKYSVNGKEIASKKFKVVFDYDVVKIEDLGNTLILLIEDKSTGDVQKQPLNNIMAIDENAKIIWRISELTKINEHYTNFYIKIADNQEQVLEVKDCMGIRYTIRLSDLTLIKKEGFRF